MTATPTVATSTPPMAGPTIWLPLRTLLFRLSAVIRSRRGIRCGSSAWRAGPSNAPSAALQKLRETAVPRGVSNLLPIFTAKASNAELWDVEGKRYIDFAGGIGCLNMGHRAPRVVAHSSASCSIFSFGAASPKCAA